MTREARDRARIEGEVECEHFRETHDERMVRLQLEVLLDIRELLRDIKREQGTSKWGSKL